MTWNEFILIHVRFAGYYIVVNMSVGANYLKVIKSFAIASDTSCTFWLLIVCNQRSHMESIDPIHPNPIRPLFYNLWNPKAESVCWSSNRSKYNMKTKYPIYVKKWYRKSLHLLKRSHFSHLTSSLYRKILCDQFTALLTFMFLAFWIPFLLYIIINAFHLYLVKTELIPNLWNKIKDFWIIGKSPKCSYDRQQQ